MNKNIHDITENDLHAYVDKQLSADKVAAVEALIQEKPEVAQQVQEWQAQNEALSQFYKDKEKSFTQVPEQLNVNALNNSAVNINGTKNPKKQSLNKFYSIAASLLLVTFGGLVGWFANGTAQPQTINTTSFVNSAISAYQVYSVEVLHPVEVGADKQKHLVNWLSKRLDYPLTVPNLQNYGYKLLGGRLLAMREGRPAAQLMFENAEGKRITLLVSKNPKYLDQSFHLKNEQNVNAFYWMDNQVAYSVTGKISSASLRKLSKSVYQQLSVNGSHQVAKL